MGTNSFLYSTGSYAWDIGSNWSLGTVPQSGDDVTVTGVSSGSLSLTIAATDPAYTVNSLTETTTNTSGLEFLSVAGNLTVTGATSITTGMLSVAGSGSLSLGSVTLSGSAELVETGTASSLSVTSLTAGSGTAPGSVLVSGGSATIGSVAGGVTVSVTSASATIGTSAGTSYLSLNNGLLNIQSSATSLADTVQLANNTSTIDLTNIAYQTGETASVALVSSGIFNYYSIVLKSLQGQIIYTFQKVEGVGAANAQTAPVISLAKDTGSGTNVTLACYASDTRIAVPNGEAPIDSLKIGDLVSTAAGAARPIKWIGRRSFAGRFLQSNPRALPIRFHAGALGNNLPHRALRVSPEHAMLIDGLLIPAACLVNGVTIVQDTACERIDYVHLELETHDVILAEGAPSETFVDDNSRGIFQNAAEFARMYPQSPSKPARYCAPRIEDGEELDAIRRRLARLANPAATFGAGIEGHLDEASRGRVRGWARDTASSGQPLHLQIVIDGFVHCEVLADTFRPDLLAAGIGNGRHAFDVTIPGGLSPDTTHIISVRRKDNGLPLAETLCA